MAEHELPSLLEKLRVRDIMTQMVDAAHVLLECKIGCLPVIDNGTLVGIVTDMDCVRAFLETTRGA
jgi:CBS domain-containing protein